MLHENNREISEQLEQMKDNEENMKLEKSTISITNILKHFRVSVINNTNLTGIFVDNFYQL